MYVLEYKLRRFRLCDNDFGITPVDDITIGITCAAFCFHIAHYYYYYYYYCYYLLQLSSHSVAAVLTLVQTKKIRINVHKLNNTKRNTNNIKHSTYKYTHYQHTHTVNTPTLPLRAACFPIYCTHIIKKRDAIMSESLTASMNFKQIT
jgi:hypothetical protein